MALFAILFGTRHIDATEHHQGLVAAIAFELVVKLIAFVSVGLFVTFGLFDGFGDLFSARRRAAAGGAPDDHGADRRLDAADAAVDAGDHLPAAAVPGDRRRERRRAPPQQGDLAVPALPAADQRLRPADRGRRAAAVSSPALSMPTPSCSRCRWPSSSRRLRCSRSSAGCRRRPAWSSSRRWRCRR